MVGVSRAICIPSDSAASDAQEARDLMEQWLAARGFEPHDEHPRWPCDDELERGYFLFTNQRWTILLYSGIDGELEEDNRLLLHLGRAGQPLLYVWGFESMWGYRLHDGRDVLDAWSTRYNLAPQWLTKVHPAFGDLKFLCETLGASARPRTLEQIRRSRVIARDDVRARFCDELGVGPAAIPYGDVEWRFLDAPATGTFGGFNVQRGYYVKRGFRPHPSSLNIHEIPTRSDKAADGWWPDLSFEIDENYLRAIRRLWALIHAIVTPIALIFLTLTRTAMWIDAVYRLMGWDQRSLHRGQFERELFAEAHPSFVVEGRTLRNDLRGIEMTIPVDARPLPEECRGAFLFSIGKVRIECEAVRPEADGHIRAMFRAPGRFSIVVDETFTAGDFPARGLVWKSDHEQILYYLNHWIVQTPDAFYDFHCTTRSNESQETILAAVRIVVQSLRRVETPTPISAGTSAAVAAAPTA